MLPVHLTEGALMCPHCNRELDSVLAKRVRHDLGKAYLHACPHCRKVLGVSHRKGFWMG